MKSKKVLAFVLTAVLALGVNSGTAQAAMRKKITDVNLSVTADIVSGGLVEDQQAEVKAKTSKFDVGEYEFDNDGFQWTETDIPRMEVKLYAEDGYYFSTYDTSYTIQGGTYVKQKKEDFSQTLTVTIELPSVYEFTQKIQDTNWTDDHSASWKKSSGGWWYEYSDGTYPINSWQKVKGEWYYFDERGYMKTGWIVWNQRQYYCDKESGQMFSSCITPDGAMVGADGARNY